MNINPHIIEMSEEMSRLEIPSVEAHLSATPNSQYGTPRVTINRDATVDLDSTNAFEGPEKLLEVWFSPSVDDLPPSCTPLGLKAVEPDTWKDMLDLVNCKILSIIKSEHMDAYLLSESSMFVFPHKVILKTCGTTTLLSGVPLMLEIAALHARFPYKKVDLADGSGVPVAAAPYRVFYSRKNFQYPNRQRGLHKNWSDEVRFLDSIFLGGSAYLIGKTNGEHWHLWLTGPHTQLRAGATAEEIAKAELDEDEDDDTESKHQDWEDETLEILMTDLDEQNARKFFLKDAGAMAEKHYLQQVKDARKEAASNLGTLQDAAQDDDATFDVFGQADLSPDLTDLSGTASDDDDTGSSIPEDLTTEGHALGTVVADQCGLSAVYPPSRYPSTRIDAYLFNPCGFSANGVVPAPLNMSPTSSRNNSHYFTVHVTPEPHCSFASFETNVPVHQSGRQTAEIVEQVVKIFRPGRFSVTLFEAIKDADDVVASGGAKTRGLAGKGMDSIPGYRRTDRILHSFKGYVLVFRHYERVGWVRKPGGSQLS